MASGRVARFGGDACGQVFDFEGGQADVVGGVVEVDADGFAVGVEVEDDA